MSADKLMSTLDRRTSDQVPEQRPIALSDWLLHAMHADLVSRPSAEVRAWASARRVEVRPALREACARHPRISLQIRRGDKCAGLRTSFACAPLRAYEEPLARVRAQYNSCSVLLATDGHEIIDELTMPGGPLSDYHVSFLRQSPDAIVHTGRLQRCLC